MGNLQLLDTEDKGDWIKTILKVVDEERSSEGERREERDLLDIEAAVRALDGMNKASLEDQLWSIAAEDDILKSRSWRRSLVLLKSLYPEPGERTPSTATNLSKRLTSMRDNLDRVLSRNVEKLRELREGIPSNPQNHVNLYGHRVVAEESGDRKVEDEASMEEQLMREIQARMEEQSSIAEWSGAFPQKGQHKLRHQEKKRAGDDDSTVNSHS